MFKIKDEIFAQYKALKHTYEHIIKIQNEIKGFINENNFRSITFIGCGSSYSLCKSARVSANMRLDMPVYDIAAGDLMLNFPHYKKMIKDTLLVAPSRSGSTSEVILTVERAKEESGASCISICTKEASQLSGISQLNIELPWAFDESVCQTRTVTNLYMANMLLLASITGDKTIMNEIQDAVNNGYEYINKNKELLKSIAEGSSWNKVVVLADSELEGIAEEGALAFKEICQLHSNYYHLLDVRHGPMVLIDEKTLVIMMCSPYQASYQRALINDLQACGAEVVTVSTQKDNPWGSSNNITIPSYTNYCVTGIPFIFVPQALAYFKAAAIGVNPDQPKGLKPWIEL